MNYKERGDLSTKWMWRTPSTKGSLRKKYTWQTSIWNVGFYTRQVSPNDCIQPYLITNMCIYSRRALTHFCTWSHSLGIEVALWHQNQPNIKACKVCKEGLVEDEYHLLYICSPYSAIRESYDDILRGDDDLNATLKRIPRRFSSYVYALFTHQDLVLQSMNIPS